MSASSEYSFNEKEQGLKINLGEARNEASLAKERVTALNERCRDLTADLKQAVDRRSEAESELNALKVSLHELAGTLPFPSCMQLFICVL